MQNYIARIVKKGLCVHKFIEETIKASKATHYVKAKGDIKFCSAPNSKAKVIWMIKNGAKVTVISSSKGWSYVQYAY